MSDISWCLLSIIGSMKTQHFTTLRPSQDLPEIAATFHRAEPPNPTGEARSWYTIRNVSKSEAEILIYDEIGFWGVTAADFIRDLSEVKASKINLRINSPGGDVFDGVAIHNAIARHTAEVTVWVDGLAASAASFIAMAGDEVVMSRYSQMMIHEASGLAIGNAADMRKLAEMLDKTSDNIAAIYAAKAGGTAEDWRAAMREETWYSDQEAVDAGLANRIDGVEPVATNVKNEVPAPAPEPAVTEPVADAEALDAIDFSALFEQIAQDAEDALFEQEDVNV